jgi:hypothetical protein
MRKLLTDEKGSAKLRHGAREDILSAILYLAPTDSAGCGDVCPWATEDCAAACLATSGRGQVTGPVAGIGGIASNIAEEARLQNMLRYPIHRARIARTRWFFEDRPGFLRQLAKEIRALEKRARKRGAVAAVRLNGTSDIPFERLQVRIPHPDHTGPRAQLLYLEGTLPELFPNVRFYDYTKGYSRMLSYLAQELPSNYDLTFSRSGENDAECAAVLASGGNIAAVFAQLPTEWLGAPVIDGTAHDLRFLDPPGSVVGLLPRGRAKHDRSGFVVRGQGEKS